MISTVRELGQVFTPPEVADFMARWIIGPTCHTVLDPGYGSGNLSKAVTNLSPEVNVLGVELDKNLEDLQIPFHNVLHGDYLTIDLASKFDGVICNPPYIKFQFHDTSKIKSIALQAGIELSGFSNLYILFIIKALNELKQGGKAAFIVPYEFFNADYGIQFKKFLITTGWIRKVFIFDSTFRVFKDHSTTSCILLFEKKPSEDGLIEFYNPVVISDLCLISQEKFSGKSGRFYRLSTLRPEIKWREYYEFNNQIKIQNPSIFIQYAKAMRGIATGSNDYFVFNHKKAEEYGIPSSCLLPCITKSVHINIPIFTNENFDDLFKNNQNVFLLNAENNLSHPNILRYIRFGEELGVHKLYLTSKRNPWFKLENRPSADMWLSVFNRDKVKFVINESKALNLTTFHSIYIKRNSLKPIISAYLLTKLAVDLIIYNRRDYGDGLIKFEPNDLNKSIVVNFESITEADRFDIENLYSTYKASFNKDLLAKIESIFSSYV